MIPVKIRANSRLFILLILLAFAAAALSACGGEAKAPLGDSWMDLRMGPPLIPLFNEVARSDDIARIDHPDQIGQLRQIENGRKMVIFKSIAEAEQRLPDIAGEIDIIGYNLENGQTTPAGELQDPVNSIMAMRELADAHDLLLAFGPDHDLALSHGVQMAPFADIFVLQIQRQQTNPRTVAEFVEPLVPELREANPDIEVSVQVRTEGDVQAVIDMVDSLEVELDGISILTSPDTVDEAEEMVTALRP